MKIVHRQNVLGRIYNKKHRKRSEIQERPNKPFADAIRDKIHGSTVDHDLEGKGGAD